MSETASQTSTRFAQLAGLLGKQWDNLEKQADENERKHATAGQHRVDGRE